MRHALFCLALLTSMLLVSAAQANIDAANYHSFWLWGAVRPQPVLAQAETLYILQGQISERHGGRRFIPQGITIPHLRHSKVWLVYRVETLDWSDAIYRLIQQQLIRWKNAGNSVEGIQIDFDARTLRMARYITFLRQLRAQLPAEYHLSITGLLDWSNHSSPQVVNQLADIVDEVVIQTYQGRHTIPNYAAYLPRLARLQIPFKIGLVQNGEWQEPDYLPHTKAFRGYVVFLLNQ